MKHLSKTAYVLNDVLMSWENANAEPITNYCKYMVEHEMYGYFDGKKNVNQDLQAIKKSWNNLNVEYNVNLPK